MSTSNVAEKRSILPPPVTMCAERPHEQQSRILMTLMQYQHLQQKGPIISRIDPVLQQQWDHAANAHLGPIDIKPYSNKKVWWICDQCPDGYLHRWEANVANRSNGSGCPQCRGREVCQHNSLATKAPKVAAQWDYEANAGTPDSVVAHSKQLVGWLCDACGHKWSTTPNQRLKKSKSGCPECYENIRGKNQVKHPTFAECRDPHSKAILAEWDSERNAAKGNFSHKTRLHSHKQIFWLCNKCPAGQQHSWFAKPFNRSSKNKSGCPVCAGKVACKCNSLQALYPAIAVEWDHSENKSQPSDHTAGSTFVAWWSSPQRGSWQQSINSRTTSFQKSTRSKQIQQRRGSASPT